MNETITQQDLNLLRGAVKLHESPETPKNLGDPMSH